MLHLMDLLKDIGEKKPDQWKASCSKKAQTIRKEKSPSLLKALYTHMYSSDQEISSNLVAGFKKMRYTSIKCKYCPQSFARSR